MTIHYQGHGVTLHHGDCLDVLRTLPDASVDSVVTDPPYGLEFMGKDWDAPWKASSVGRGVRVESERAAEMTERGKGHSTPGGPFLAARVDSTRVAGKPFQDWCEAWAAECLRVLKPGGHLLAFGGTRTWHRLACAVEDAGFEVRDSIAWMYGSGFPKSLDVSKAIDKRANVNDEMHRRIALVAEVIRTHREAKGMERSAVSLAVVGTPSGACWNWEHQQLPSAEMWPAIKRALDIPDKFDGLIEGTRAQFIGAEREVIGTRTVNGAEGSAGGYADGIASQRGLGGVVREIDLTAPATPDAERWQGWGTALKPSHEPVCVARKPLRDSDILDTIGSHLDALEAQWQAPEADQTTPTGAAGGSPDRTDASPSASTALTSSSTVSSWRACWVELCELTSTSTTETTSSTTTALKTLSSSLSSLTHESTHPSATSPHGSTSLASAVDNLFASVVCGLRATLALSAAEPATGRTPRSPLAAVEGSPAFEPVVVARKPLIGTVAANVTAHGTGALNIDGCRIGGGDDRTSGGPTGARIDAGEGYGGGWSDADAGRARPSGGRWPANVALDESQAEALDEQSGTLTSGANPTRRGSDKFREAYGDFKGQAECDPARGADAGGASRFFFVASHDKGDTSALTGKGGRIESCETASTAAESSSPPRQFGDSALGGAVTSEHPDTASQTGSPSTSATPSGSRPSGRPATPTTQNIDAESSPEQQPGERTPTASPASSVGPSAPTVTTTTTTSPSTSAGSAAPATSDTTSQWKALGDTDSAPFKYVAKADATERPRVDGTAHPTVKPLTLMRWLVRLVTPPGGTVLEPFAGSGTTVEACLLEGFGCIAIEKGDEYLPLIMQRIHRRRDPVAAIRQTGDELGLFELDGEGA